MTMQILLKGKPSDITRKLRLLFTLGIIDRLREVN